MTFCSNRILIVFLFMCDVCLMNSIKKDVLDTFLKDAQLVPNWFFSRNCCASSYDTTFGDLKGFCNNISIFDLRKFLSTDKVFLDSSFRVPWEFPEGFCQDFWNIAWILQSYYRKSAPHQGFLQSLLKNPFMCSSLTDQATQFSQDIISAKFCQDWLISGSLQNVFLGNSLSTMENLGTLFEILLWGLCTFVRTHHSLLIQIFSQTRVPLSAAPTHFLRASDRILQDSTPGNV